MKLVGKFLSVDARSASSCPGWISTLDHEVRDDSMEHCVVVVSPPGELAEVSAGIRCMFPIKFDGKLAETTMKVAVSK